MTQFPINLTKRLKNLPLKQKQPSLLPNEEQILKRFLVNCYPKGPTNLKMAETTFRLTDFKELYEWQVSQFGLPSSVQLSTPRVFCRAYFETANSGLIPLHQDPFYQFIFHPNGGDYENHLLDGHRKKLYGLVCPNTPHQLLYIKRPKGMRTLPLSQHLPELSNGYPWQVRVILNCIFPTKNNP